MIYVPHVDHTTVATGAIFVLLSLSLQYGPLFGQSWLAAMKRDKNGDHWMQKDPKASLPGLFLKEFLLSLCKAWTTGLLLNLTQAGTILQAAQLGAFLFFGTVAPAITSEYLWEKRGMDLLRFKYLSGFVSTVLLSVLMNSLGTA